MKLNSRMHAAIDYGIVMFLLIAPTYFSLPGITSKFTYGLAAIHLLLTVCTNYELGIFKVIPFKVHGIIELLVAIALIGAAYFLGNYEGDLSRYFYISFAIIVFITWLMSDYKNLPKH